MNLKELYACCGGDFDTVMDIWRSDERVARFLGRFLEDGSYANFHKFLDAGNLPEAFRAVHTLKGVVPQPVPDPAERVQRHRHRRSAQRRGSHHPRHAGPL